jgi:hypothetical protein
MVWFLLYYVHFDIQLTKMYLVMKIILHPNNLYSKLRRK